MYDKYPDELAHYGILGMKWGVRRYQNAAGGLTPAGKKRYRSGESSKWLEPSLKDGKDKPNISPAEKLTKNAKTTIDTTSNIYKNVKNLKKTDNDLSNMTDDELKTKINRMSLEKQYNQLSSEQKSSGKDYVMSALEIAGGVAVIAGSVVSTMAVIKSMKT